MGWSELLRVSRRLLRQGSYCCREGANAGVRSIVTYLKPQLPTVVFWKQLGWGSFAYKLYSDEEPDVPFAEDELQVKKPA